MNNDELIAAGHELAKCLDSSTPLLDIAKLLSKMASQLDVTTAALREKTKQCEQLAAENAYLLPKAASELSNAWVLHKYLIGIQASIMYLDVGNKTAAQEWLYGTIAGPGFEFPDGVEDIDAWATHQMRGSISHPRALEIIKAETPDTDAFLSEVRAQAITSALDSLDGVFDTDCVMETNGISYEEAEQRTTGALAVNSALIEFAAELRKGGAA
ncbi:hypothetical protein [Cronobacter sakazakii]|uniref:hypothetical protein n=1 Tax=Cronobacter sakazakii TaxID=28141 RepID=UPI000CFBF5A0|nr:hypothetical protein [Cronobacter sakazakii]PQY30051.1 hypothetical protein C5958_14400 [Cronobacter sakazakii]